MSEKKETKAKVTGINENEKKLKINNKATTAAFVIAIILLVVVIAQSALSLFSAQKEQEESVEIGKIEVILKEDWPDIGDEIDVDNDGVTETYTQFGIKKYTKQVWGLSTGNLDAYVRVRCIPIIEYFVEDEGGQDPENRTGKWITAPVSQDSIIVAVNAMDENGNDTWVKQGDYWYYTNILSKEQETTKMTIDWQVAKIPTEISAYPIRSNVRVILEYSQTTHNMWKDIFQIENLPDAVETVEE